MEHVTSEEPSSFTRLIVAKGDFLCANKNAVKHLYFLRELEGDPSKTLASDSVLCTRPFLKVSSKARFGTLLVFCTELHLHSVHRGASARSKRPDNTIGCQD